MDDLMKSALAFRRLLDFEYEIIAGSKGHLLEMMLCFKKEHFMHLVGLHKLRDLQFLKNSSHKIFDLILKGRLTYQDISKSVFFSEIEDRIRLFPILEEALDSNELIIKYKKELVKGTFVQASHIFVYPFKGTILHFFVDCDTEEGKYFGRSFFSREDDRFLKNQQTFKILQKTKCDMESRKRHVLKDKLVLS